MQENKNYPFSRIGKPIITLFILIVLIGLSIHFFNRNSDEIEEQIPNSAESVLKNWKAPDTSTIPQGKAGEEIRYGRELIANTSVYFGPKGKIKFISNGMNCQNCHNDAGTKPYAFNFSAVASTYPQFRNRSESIASIADRINSCFIRSLNGQALDTNSHEMTSMIAYINWVGKDVPKGVKPENAGVMKLAYLDRAADPEKGKVAYATCEGCHGKDGQGLLNEKGNVYTYPPLWGTHSYNDGAGMQRLGNFAGFIKDNMPFGTNYKHPVLTDEEAWDVAAFVNSQPRPHKDQSKDYTDLTHKPFDSPTGPYADSFPEKQHKYGPYKPIIMATKKIDHP